VLPEDLYDLRWAGEPRITPDGTTVAYSVGWIDRDENTYRSAIWTVRVDGSAPPRQLTSGKKADGSPRWSPDGTRLAFTSNRDGDQKQLYVLPLSGGEPVCLTELKEDATEPVWSPDGTRIAFCARVPDPAYEEEDDKKRLPRRFTRHRYKLDSVGWVGDRRTHVFVVPADGSGEATQLTDGDFEDSGPAWSPDSRTIAFASARDDDWDVQLQQQIWVVGTDGGGLRRVTPEDDHDWYEAPSWSPDGASIACRTSQGGFDRPRHDQVAIVDASSGERRVLTDALDLQCGPYPDAREPVWDGESLLFSVEDHGNVHVRRAPVAGGDAEVVVGGDQWVHAFDIAAGVIVHAASTPTMPGEVYCGERRLTEASAAFCEQASPLPSERFVAVSPDGSEVEAWLVRPRGIEPGKRYPVLLNIHGGPFTQYGNKFFDEFQVYAHAGYAVLYSNPRGSSGYSEAWGRAIRGPVDGGGGWGSVDYDDLMAVVNTALEQFDFLDGERMGVIGGSYGGYMTSWIVGHTDRFRAACSERAVNNMLSEFGSSDFGWFHRAYTGVWPFEDVQPYLDQSPTTYAAAITTPLLILHSENDLRCNIEQGEHLFTILRLLGREVEFVRFPAESHELTRSGSPFHRVTRFEVLLDWFARYLQ
jgi:dipeptidyl aminopeptidase/acylaminoacyl peptidase